MRSGHSLAILVGRTERLNNNRVSRMGREIVCLPSLYALTEISSNDPPSPFHRSTTVFHNPTRTLFPARGHPKTTSLTFLPFNNPPPFSSINSNSKKYAMTPPIEWAVNITSSTISIPDLIASRARSLIPSNKFQNPEWTVAPMTKGYLLGHIFKS